MTLRPLPALLVAFFVASLATFAAGEPEPRATSADEVAATPQQPQKAASSAPAAARRADRKKAQILLVGIDGLDPELVRRWTKDGSMPNLARLIDAGTMAEIDCVVGTSSPVVWTTVATGVPPTLHGITGFKIGDDPVNSSHRTFPAFWKILPDRGIDLATLGWMVSWPSEDDTGIMVPDRAWLGRFHEDVRPKGVVEPLHHVPHVRRNEILERFTTFPFDPKYAKNLSEDDPQYSVHYLIQHRLLKIFRRDGIYAGVAREVARENDLDVLAVYFQGPDYVSHGFWQWFEPEPFQKKDWNIPQEQIDALENVIPAYYRHVDDIVGELLPLVDENALVILLSDHGFQPAPAWRNSKDYSIEARFLSGNHRKKATLVLSGPQVAKGAPANGRVTHFDVLPTLLYALDLPQARDHRGRPLEELFTEDYRATRNEQTIETYVTTDDAAAKPTVRSEHDGEIIEELRSLGYVQ